MAQFQLPKLDQGEYKQTVMQGTDTSPILSGNILDDGSGMIGAIRERAKQKFNQEMGTLGLNVGKQARQATASAQQTGLAMAAQKQLLDEEQRRLAEERKAARKRARAGIVGTIAGIAGAGVGFAAGGGPAGALAGYNIGQGVGTMGAL